jgi:hypothetical protein
MVMGQKGLGQIRLGQTLGLAVAGVMIVVGVGPLWQGALGTVGVLWLISGRVQQLVGMRVLRAVKPGRILWQRGSGFDNQAVSMKSVQEAAFGHLRLPSRLPSRILLKILRLRLLPFTCPHDGQGS